MNGLKAVKSVYFPNKRPLNFIADFQHIIDYINANYSNCTPEKLEEVLLELYQREYLDQIDLEQIRIHFNIPDTDKLKKNGYWKRNLFICLCGFLICVRVRMRVLQWVTINNERVYVSVFPNFIIKYGYVATETLEECCANFRNDSFLSADMVFPFEDPTWTAFDDKFLSSLRNLEKACKENGYSENLSSQFLQIYNTSIDPGVNLKTIETEYVFPYAYLLHKIGQVFKNTVKNVFSYLNKKFHFLRCE